MQDSPLTSGGLQLQSSEENESEIRSAASPYYISSQKTSEFSSGTPQTPASSVRMNDSNKDSASPMGVRFSRGREKRLDDTIDDLNVRQNYSVVHEREKDTDEIDGEVDDGLRLEPCGIILSRYNNTEKKQVLLHYSYPARSESTVENEKPLLTGYGTVDLSNLSVMFCYQRPCALPLSIISFFHDCAY